MVVSHTFTYCYPTTFSTSVVYSEQLQDLTYNKPDMRFVLGKKKKESDKTSIAMNSPTHFWRTRLKLAIPRDVLKLS